MTKGVNSAWLALRIGLGLGPFLAGLDTADEDAVMKRPESHRS
jgi:hypothetical protein